MCPPPCPLVRRGTEHAAPGANTHAKALAGSGNREKQQESAVPSTSHSCSGHRLARQQPGAGLVLSCRALPQPRLPDIPGMDFQSPSTNASSPTPCRVQLESPCSAALAHRAGRGAQGLWVGIAPDGHRDLRNTSSLTSCFYRGEKNNILMAEVISPLRNAAL